jgi:outer membrane receptor protein involved in Fe transport
MPPQATQPSQRHPQSQEAQSQEAEPQEAESQEDQPTVPVTTPQRGGSSRMSRRSILRGAAGAGAVGVAAAGGAGAALALTRPSAQAALTNEAKPAVIAAMPPNAMEGPLVVYVSDTTTGLLDVFAGTGQTRLKNPALVRALLRALK